MAQAMSLNMRIPTEDANSDPQIPSEIDAFLLRSQERIIQTNISKSVLQIMLAVMLLSAGIAILNVQLYEVLPANMDPCTIWGQLVIEAVLEQNKYGLIVEDE